MKTKERVYQFILDYWKENLIAPSYADIQIALGIKSNQNVHLYVHQLAAEGRLIIVHKGGARSMRPVGMTIIFQ